MKCFPEKRFFYWVEDEVSVTLRARGGSYDGGSEVLVIYSIDEKMGSTYIWEEQANTLACRDYKQPQAVLTEEDTMTYQDTTGALLASGYDKLGTQEAANGMYVTETTEESVITATTGEFTQVDVDKASTLMSRDYKDPQIISRPRSVVRRLTPRECERLQGFPDDWTLIGKPEEVTLKDGTTEVQYFYTDRFGKKKRCTDSARYKALGNSIAVGYANQQSGYWCWLARRTCAQYEHQVTMGSLFDGIGGFPLAFAACGAVPIWASEIEDFCIEVTRRRFPDPDDMPVD